MLAPLGKRAELYRGHDPRDVPAYTVGEVSRLTGVCRSTLASWVHGQKGSVPVIGTHGEDGGYVSFMALAELHVLAALRRHHRISLQKIRTAIKYIADMADSGHPLLDLPLKTDGVSLFVDYLGDLIDCSKRGQIGMKQVLDAYLERIERDERGPQRLYPFTRDLRSDTQLEREPRLIVIDPRIAFGQPVIAGTRIRTSIINERFRAGESATELAKDYGRGLREIEEALRCEGKAA